MFFKLHSKAIIGYKLLTDADLGNKSSHQTHIGLFEETLNFITDFRQQSFAQFIYKNNCKELLTFLDPIVNPNGTVRSPKIRSGSEQEIDLLGTRVNSVVREIREITINKKKGIWYLMWFGLENEDIVFFLFEKESEDYKKILKIISEFKNRGIIKPSEREFNIILKFLNEKVNQTNIQYIEQLEIAAQVDQKTDSFINLRKPREYDIEKAKKIFKEIGKKGEYLINEFLYVRKQKSEIMDYKWLNQIRETGMPYDFEIKTNENKLIYSDVKSTSYKFDQNMIFSGQEFKFINQNSNYLIHRVYNLSGKPMLKICKNIKNVAGIFIPNLDVFTRQIKKDGMRVSGIKVEVPPTLKELRFENEIVL